MIAFCTPELHGDVLWSIPAARELARRHGGNKADFYVGHLARNLVDLLSVQSFVNEVICDPNWRPGTEGPCTGGKAYETMYQLGFRAGETIHGTLLDHFGKVAGVGRQDHRLDLPVDYYPRTIPEEPFVCMCLKGHDQSHIERWGDLFREFAKRCPIPVVEVGIPGKGIATDVGAIDRTSDGFLEMAWIISRCRYFLGSISAPLVVADAFPTVTRIAVHDGVTWNLGRCTRSELNHYPVNPTVEQLLAYIH